MTWQAFIERVETVRRARYTRQSLAKHGRIQQAFSNHIQRQEQKSTRRPEVEILKDRIDRLQAETSRLEAFVPLGILPAPAAAPVRELSDVTKLAGDR